MKELYAFNYNPNQEAFQQKIGWDVYDVVNEYNRMEVPKSLWMQSSQNIDYKVGSYVVDNRKLLNRRYQVTNSFFVSSASYP